jgi:hypothetical protein
MKHIELPSQAELAELFDYSPVTGRLYWKKCRAGQIKPGREAGFVSKNGYRNVEVGYRPYLVHRLIWKLVTGQDPGELFIDHADGDKHNNSWQNLRLATRPNNIWNQPKRRHNRTGLKGVSQNGAGYRAEIRVNGTRIHLGTYKTPEEAHSKYCEAADRLHGEYANY